MVRRSPYNLLTFSEQFDNAAWTKISSSISSNVTIAPNGTLTADKLVEDTALSTHLILQLPAGSISGNVYTFSFYAKAAERFNVSAVNNAAGGGQAAYNLNTGAVTFTSGISASMQLVGDGWYRCILTYSPTVTGSFNTHIRLANASGANTYQGDGTSGLFIWGAQLVEGTEALDYFPTTNRQDVPRIDFRNADGTLSSCGRLLLEPQRTNSIRNSSMVGAVAGSPGTLPTNYSEVLAGLTRSVVAVGTENGLPYIDVQFSGTATGDLFLRYESATAIVAANTQTWTVASYLKFINQPAPPSFTVFSMIERTSGGSFITSATSSALSVTSSLNRFSFTRTLAGGATVGAIQPQLAFILNVGQTYNFTIRIAAPQMELGAYATTWVPTTTAAVTRLADTASKTGVSSLIGQTEGTIFIETASINVLGVGGGVLFSIATDVNNRIVVFVSFAGALVFSRSISGAFVDIFTIPNFIASTSGRAKIAFAYKAGDYAYSINGSAAVTSTNAAAIPAMSRIDLASTVGILSIDERITQAALFPTRLTNAQLAQLTTL